MTDLIRSAGRGARARALLTLALSVGALWPALPATAQPLRPDPAPAPAAEKPAVSPVPFRMRGEQVDFGVVRPHIESSTVLEIFNASKFPITLTRVTASCSCMGGVVAGSEVVAPGDLGKITIAVKGRANPGPIRERVTVWYIDPETGREKNFGIPVVGEVADAVKAEPFFINLLASEPKGTIELTSTDGFPFQVRSFAGKAPVFDFSKMREGVDPVRDSLTRWVVHYDFRDTPEERVPDFVVVETDHPLAPLVTLRVINRRLLTRSSDPTVRPWSVSQDSFNLGRLALGKSIERKVTVVAPRLANEFSASVADEHVSVEVVEVTDASRGKDVLLRFTMRDGDAGVVETSVTLTNGPEQMTLPVFALSAPDA